MGRSGNRPDRKDQLKVTGRSRVIISILPKGNLANRMIAFMFAKSLAWSIGGDITINCSLPEWNFSFDSDLHSRLLADSRNALLVLDRDVESIQDICLRWNSSGKHSSVLDGYFQRIHLFDPPSQYQCLFPPSNSGAETFGDDELVINVRAGDILKGVTWYPLMPVPFYRSLVERTGLRPTFLGQLGDSAYLREIRDCFPHARMIMTGDPVGDFNLLRNARRICLSVSTFSWLAGWLSSAREIH